MLQLLRTSAALHATSRLTGELHDPASELPTENGKCQLVSALIGTISLERVDSRGYYDGSQHLKFHLDYKF